MTSVKRERDAHAHGCDELEPTMQRESLRGEAARTSEEVSENERRHRDEHEHWQDESERGIDARAKTRRERHDLRESDEHEHADRQVHDERMKAPEKHAEVRRPSRAARENELGDHHHDERGPRKDDRRRAQPPFLTGHPCLHYRSRSARVARPNGCVVGFIPSILGRFGPSSMKTSGIGLVLAGVLTARLTLGQGPAPEPSPRPPHLRSPRRASQRRVPSSPADPAAPEAEPTPRLIRRISRACATARFGERRVSGTTAAPAIGVLDSGATAPRDRPTAPFRRRWSRLPLPSEIERQ